jgi:hypothetical protein
MAVPSLKLLLLAMISAWPAAAAQAADPVAIARDGPMAAAEPGADDHPEIVVTAERLRGPMLGNVMPETQYDSGEIAALGAASLDQLLGALSPQTRGSAAGGPIVLLNGRRISGFSEVSSLPPEAVERIDVLPEEVARRYGYGPGSNVVNIVLLPRFRATTAEVEQSFATEGGRPVGRGDLGIVRVRDSTRWSLAGQYRREGGLLESERHLEAALDPAAALSPAELEAFAKHRSLVPEKERFSLDGSVSGFIGEVSGTLSLAAEANDSLSRFGPPAVAPLVRNTRSRSGQVGVALGGGSGRWQWSLTAGYNRARSHSDTDLAVAPSALDGDAAARERSHWSSRSASAELLVYGDMARLPAGPMSTSFIAAVHSLDFRSGASENGLLTLNRLTRDRASLQVSTDLPLLGAEAGTPAALGSLSANFTLAFSRLSDFGTIRRTGYGMDWAPMRALTLSASVNDEQRAPSIEQLGDPLTLTANTRVFDLARAETVEVTRIDGGNRDLLGGRRRLIKLGARLRPLGATDFSVRTDYFRIRERDSVSNFPGYTTELEAAFPERFIRDGSGRLLQVDYRPVNFVRARREELRWSFATTLPLREGRGESRRQNGQVDVSFLHSWTFRDEAVLRDKLATLDFLDGSAVSASGARPKHLLEFQAGLYRQGLGARLSGNLQSASFVRGIADSGGDLRFSRLATANLRIFVDFGQRPQLLRRIPWLRGARLSGGVTNIFNTRPRVRDRDGQTPFGYQPAYLDPVGRFAGISLRKLFS